MAWVPGGAAEVTRIIVCSTVSPLLSPLGRRPPNSAPALSTLWVGWAVLLTPLPPSRFAPCRAADPDKRPSFVEIVSRLSVIVERESAARHPELEADFMRRTQSSPVQTLKTFRLPPDGPAHKSAVAALERRRCALIQGHSSDGGSGAGSGGGKVAGSAPAVGAAGSAPPLIEGVASGASKDGGGAKAGAVGGTAGGALPALSECGGFGSTSNAAAASGSAAAASTEAAAEAAAGSGSSQPPVLVAAPAPLAAGAAAAAAAAAAVVAKVGTNGTDAPPSPSPVDAGQLDFARS